MPPEDWTMERPATTASHEAPASMVPETTSPYFGEQRNGRMQPIRPNKARKLAALALSIAASSTPSAVDSLVPRRSPRKAAKSVTPSPPLSSSSPPVAKKQKTKKETLQHVARTESFGALWAGSVLNGSLEASAPTPPHTLILGTHPSITSLERQQYFGHQQNAFWWIAGDCLGFRRDTGVSPSTGKPYQLAKHLRYDNILSYSEQMACLVRKGFCLWDVVHSCQRQGSLDQDIKKELPNDIPGFCDEHPTIRRIVFANGGTGSKLFCKHFGDWFASGELVAAPHEQSQKAFARAVAKGDANRVTAARTITLVSALSVSPAAAKYSYLEKRDFWEEFVYAPGLGGSETSR